MNCKPGKKIKVADALNRANLQNSRTEIPDMELDFVVHSVISSLPISSKRLNDFKQETTKNNILQKLKNFTVNGWTEKKNVPLEVRPYFNCRDEISYSHENYSHESYCIFFPSQGNAYFNSSRTPWN